MSIESELRKTAAELLSGKVSLVIGYEAGSALHKSTPFFASTPEDAERLIFNRTCVNNLAVYLPQIEGKTAVVVKPCDAASVVELVKEHQVKREDLVVIQVSCNGVLDNPKCKGCTAVDSKIADIRIGEFTPSSAPNANEYDQLSPAERRAFWAEHFSRCIRCYACRSVCPGCYCNECFVDKPQSVWISKSTDTATNWFFHMTRAMHLAGRCVGCGECERVCPAGIPLTMLGRELHAEVAEMFDSSPGTDAAMPLSTFAANDPDPCPEE